MALNLLNLNWAECSLLVLKSLDTRNNLENIVMETNSCDVSPGEKKNIHYKACIELCESLIPMPCTELVMGKQDYCFVLLSSSARNREKNEISLEPLG